MTKTLINNPEAFSDYTSLKRLIEIQKGSNKVHIHRTEINQTGSAGDVELENKAGHTIAFIGKTEIALKVKSSAADAGLEHAVITAHYLDASGDQQTGTIADAVADMNAAAVDFDTPVTDFYCWDIEHYGTDCFTSSLAVGVGKTLDAGATGTGNAQIIAAALVATKLSLLGVGTVYGAEDANQADTGYIASLISVSPWGSINNTYTWTFPADSSVATLFLDANGYPSQSFYRVRDFTLDHVALDECSIANAAKSAIYGCIDDGLDTSEFTRYMVPVNRRAWLAKMFITNGVAAVTLKITRTPLDKLASTPNMVIPYPFAVEYQPLTELEPLSECSFVINGNTATVSMDLIILEVEN
jgi:hypothetical protein